MRIGYMTPRINGISMAGLGVSPTVAGIIAQDLQSWLASVAYHMEQGEAKTPDQFRQVLYQEVNSVCINWPDQCTGADALINDAVSQYDAAYTREYIRVMQSGGTIYLPPSYVPPAPPPNYIPPPNTNPNALDTTAPVQTTVNNNTGGNVLNPPQPLPPVYSTNAGTSTGNPANTVNGPGILDSISGDVSIAGFNIPVWTLLAGGVGLFFLMGRK